MNSIKIERTHKIFLFIMLITFILISPACLVQKSGAGQLWGTIQAFEYFTRNHIQFSEHIDNSGPYAYLYTPIIYSGYAFYEKIMAYAVVCLFFSFFVSALIIKIDGKWNKFISLILLTYFPFQNNFPLLSFEIIPKLILLFSGIFLITYSVHKNRNFIFMEILTACLYAYFSLQKTNNSYLILFIILTVSIYYLINNKKLYIVPLLGTFLGALCGLWVMAGQNLNSLPQFYLSSLSFALAYQEALASPSPSFEFAFALLMVMSLLLVSLVRLVFAYENKLLFKEFFYFLIVSACTFATWKHAIIQSGVHAGIFYNFVPCLLPYLFFYEVPWNSQKYLYKLITLSSFFSLYFIVYLFFLLNPDCLRERPWKIFSEYKYRIETLFSYPLNKKQDLDQGLIFLKSHFRLPQVFREMISTFQVDEFGYSDPSVILQNNLNYSPRPIAVNFIAISDVFKEKNRNYYADTFKAPQFVFTYIDGLQVDDSGAFMELLQRYRPIGRFLDWTLMEKASNLQDTNNYLTLLGKTGTYFDKWVEVPKSDGFVWCEISIRYSLLGKIIKFFYKPSIVVLDQLIEGKEITQKVTPMSIKAGFLLSPLIANNADLLNLYQNQINYNKINKIKIVYPEGVSKVYFRPEINVRFYQINNINIPKIDN